MDQEKLKQLGGSPLALLHLPVLMALPLALPWAPWPFKIMPRRPDEAKKAFSFPWALPGPLISLKGAIWIQEAL